MQVLLRLPKIEVIFENAYQNNLIGNFIVSNSNSHNFEIYRKAFTNSIIADGSTATCKW